MNESLSALALLDWKPMVGALLLPPVPLFALLLMAWRLQTRRPLAGMLLNVVVLLALWFSLCVVTGQWFERQLSAAPPISPSQASEWRRNLSGRKPVVLVLGGGTQRLAPEYGEAHLPAASMARLHYGLWLGRQLQAPVMASGGSARAHPDGPFEAVVAGRIAMRDYGRALRWLEPASRDTRENARRSLQLLRGEGITDLFLVTDGVHMARALRAFKEEASLTGLGTRILPAAMGQASDDGPSALHWLPSPEGYLRTRNALREAFGLLVGA